jgi:hypothetical protein
MKHKFVATGENRYPKIGELIRNGQTGDLINIVLSISEEQEGKFPYNERTGKFVYIRSVRYGDTNGGNFRLLNGKRSRSFKWWKFDLWDPNTWQIVEEFARFDNTEIREHILYLMKNVQTAYIPEEEEDV